MLRGRYLPSLVGVVLDGLLGDALNLVDVLGVFALRLLVDDVTGLVDSGVHLVGVLREQILDRV